MTSSSYTRTHEQSCNNSDEIISQLIEYLDYFPSKNAQNSLIPVPGLGGYF